MAFAIVSLLFLFLTPILAYDDKYSQIDIEKILKNDDLYMEYINCLLDKGPCNAEYAQDFRDILPEMIEEACGKCNDIQKQKVRKMVNTLYEKKPELAAELQTKYDPDRKYEAKFLEFLSSN